MMAIVKSGDLIVDESGRYGKIACVLNDGIMAHPIEVDTIVYHGSLGIQTVTFWQKFGIGFSGKWFDSPRGNYYLKSKILDRSPHNGQQFNQEAKGT